MTKEEIAPADVVGCSRRKNEYLWSKGLKVKSVYVDNNWLVHAYTLSVFYSSNVILFPVKPFKYVAEVTLFELAPLHTLPWPAVIAGAGLGFSLSLLFFMDQNISSALVNTPSNKLVCQNSFHFEIKKMYANSM